MSKILENLNIADKVFYSDRHRCGISTITRLTKTQIILANGSKYKKDTGHIVGGTIWNQSSIQILTPELIQTIKKAQIKRKAIYLKDQIVIPKDPKAIAKFIEAISPYCKTKEKRL